MRGLMLKPEAFIGEVKLPLLISEWHVKADSKKSYPVEKILMRHENEKKRAYNRRFLEIEHRTFMPLVFGTSDAMGKECDRFHKIHAAKIAEKQTLFKCYILDSS